MDYDEIISAAVLHGKKDLRLENQSLSGSLGDDDVLLRVYYTGICGTDSHLYNEACVGNFDVVKPLVLGHEASGIVVKTGKNVKDLKPGDRVAIDNVIPCLRCRECKIGKPCLCSSGKICGIPPEAHGTLRTLMTHPAMCCFKLPENISLQNGALIEPLSISMYACRQAKVSSWHKVTVLGAGTIGIGTALCALAIGVTSICITDVSKDKLEKARKILGDKCRTVLVKANCDCSDEIKRVFGEADKTIECSGAAICLQTALKVTKAGGKVTAVGFGKEEMVKIDLHSYVLKEEIDIVFVYGRDGLSYSSCIDVISSGKINLSGLVTHVFQLSDIHAALAVVSGNQSDALKIMIEIQKLPTSEEGQQLF